MMRRQHQRARPWKGRRNVDAVCRLPAAPDESHRRAVVADEASETDSKVILMGHERVKLLCPALVYSKGFFKPILWSCYVRK